MVDEGGAVGYDVVDVRETADVVGGRVVDMMLVTIRTTPSGLEGSFTIPRDAFTREAVAASARSWALRLEQVKALSEKIG